MSSPLSGGVRPQSVSRRHTQLIGTSSNTSSGHCPDKEHARLRTCLWALIPWRYVLLFVFLCLSEILLSPGASWENWRKHETPFRTSLSQHMARAGNLESSEPRKHSLAHGHRYHQSHRPVSWAVLTRCPFRTSQLCCRKSYKTLESASLAPLCDKQQWRGLDFHSCMELRTQEEAEHAKRVNHSKGMGWGEDQQDSFCCPRG